MFIQVILTGAAKIMELVVCVWLAVIGLPTIASSSVETSADKLAKVGRVGSGEENEKF